MFSTVNGPQLTVTELATGATHAFASSWGGFGGTDALILRGGPNTRPVQLVRFGGATPVATTLLATTGLASADFYDDDFYVAYTWNPFFSELREISTSSAVEVTAANGVVLPGTHAYLGAMRGCTTSACELFMIDVAETPPGARVAASPGQYGTADARWTIMGASARTAMIRPYVTDAQGGIPPLADYFALPLDGGGPALVLSSGWLFHDGWYNAFPTFDADGRYTVVFGRSDTLSPEELYVLR